MNRTNITKYKWLSGLISAGCAENSLIVIHPKIQKVCFEK
jgi:hypothetical protein